MYLDVGYNNFQLSLGTYFFPKEISEKYEKYLNRLPEWLTAKFSEKYTTVHNLIMLTIQSINIPGISFEPVEQQQTPGRNIKWRSAKPTQELFSKTLTINFKLLSGAINYWIMYEILNSYYSFDNKEPFVNDFVLRIFDHQGNVLVSVVFEKVLFVSLGELNLNYNQNNLTMNTFECTFNYNNLKIKLENE